MSKSIEISDGKLVIGKDTYQLKKILEIYAVEMKIKDHLIRIFTFAFLFSAIGWAIFYLLGYALFAIGFVLAILTMKKYELRALHKGSDETGDQIVSLLRSRKEEDFERFKQVVEEVKSAKRYQS
ncbi:hypothetical protein [Zooshikella harenae]|uniref:DUF202 domain-containing protein n=1 Tax=Zooshikella harenae TaxID=2827238 RepID=A0ABS5ZJQ1_9GAMM|nr:hypothetical protein [Zooshikella harenae]MBU2714118.1 hypothetical protein [Zooshikella harenae]